MSVVNVEVADRFENFIFDWDYEQYLVIGGYGSGKSYHVALKIVLKCLEEKRTVLVVRDVYDTLKESCFALFKEILLNMGIMDDKQFGRSNKRRLTKVIRTESPMEFRFPNGSRIIFKGMDNPEKMKSIHGVSIVWLEECSEMKFAAFEELLGRIRQPGVSLHFILSCNPIGRENWVYNHFFATLDDEGHPVTIVDEEEFYEKRTLICNGIYYHHSTPDDNPYLPKQYLRRLDKIKEYDKPLWVVARLGRFGASGIRVLPQFMVAENAKEFVEKIRNIPLKYHYFGFDFGFEDSFNAVVSMAVDDENKILYIYNEIYRNKIVDSRFCYLPEMVRLKKKLRSPEYRSACRMLIADNEDPKAIMYYRQQGFPIRGCKNKFHGSRLSNTRKVKRFHRIICSPRCKNVIRELKYLVYAKDRDGNAVYDEFNIDPHTFSAIWYGLDNYTVADIKDLKRNSVKGD